QSSAKTESSVTVVSSRIEIPPVFDLREYQREWIDDTSRFMLMVKSARIGITFATVIKECLDCLERPTTWTILAAAKAQAVEAVDAAHKIREAMGFFAEVYDEPYVDSLGASTDTQTRIQFANGSRIIA